MSEKTSVATPTRTGIVSRQRRAANVSMSVRDTESSHELGQALTSHTKLLGSGNTMYTGPHQGGAGEALLEREPGRRELPRAGWLRAAERRRQSGRTHDASLRAAHGERGQHGLQLADVARPIRARQHGWRGAAEGRAAPDS